METLVDLHHKKFSWVKTYQRLAGGAVPRFTEGLSIVALFHKGEQCTEQRKERHALQAPHHALRFASDPGVLHDEIDHEDHHPLDERHHRRRRDQLLSAPPLARWPTHSVVVGPSVHISWNTGAYRSIFLFQINKFILPNFPPASPEVLFFNRVLTF